MHCVHKEIIILLHITLTWLAPSAGQPAPSPLTSLNEEPKWCLSDVDSQSTMKALKTEGLRIDTYAAYLLYGHGFLSGFQIYQLNETSKCNVPNLPNHPLVMHMTNNQVVANTLWDLTLLNQLYRETFKLIRVHQQLRTSKEDLFKLTTLQVMVDHYIDLMEEYLSAERCSCEDVNCSIHEISTSVRKAFFNETTADHHPTECREVHLLGQVIKMIRREIRLLDSTGYLGRETTTYDLCMMFSRKNFPDGCPIS